MRGGGLIDFDRLKTMHRLGGAGHSAGVRGWLRVVAAADACYRGPRIRRSEASTL
jgi:hypothetical protein